MVHRSFVSAGDRGELEDTTTVVYVSPLKALGNDIAKNLQQPLAEIFHLAYGEGLMLPGDSHGGAFRRYACARAAGDGHAGRRIF